MAHSKKLTKSLYHHSKLKSWENKVGRMALDETKEDEKPQPRRLQEKWIGIHGFSARKRHGQNSVSEISLWLVQRMDWKDSHSRKSSQEVGAVAQVRDMVVRPGMIAVDVENTEHIGIYFGGMVYGGIGTS